MFYKHERDNKVAILIVYEEVILKGEDNAKLEILKKKVVTKFEIKNLCMVKYNSFGRSSLDIRYIC